MITEDVKTQMRDIAARYPSPRSAMLPCLHLVQEVEGYVTPDGILAVADVVGVKPDEVDSVVSFYSMYHRHPVGQHVIKVCTSISCYLRGCDNLLEHLEERLAVQRGQTTADGQFTLQGVECLAACGMAPVLQVDDEFVENVTIEGADQLIERLKRGDSVASRAGNWNVTGAGTAAGTRGNATEIGAQREKAE